MESGRFIEEQKDSINRLNLIYSKFKDESLDKMMCEKRGEYENERAKLWNMIEKTHRILEGAGKYDKYEKHYEKAVKTNRKFQEMMTTWASSDRIPPYIPTIGNVNKEKLENEVTVEGFGGNYVPKGETEKNIIVPTMNNITWSNVCPIGYYPMMSTLSNANNNAYMYNMDFTPQWLWDRLDMSLTW